MAGIESTAGGKDGAKAKLIGLQALKAMQPGEMIWDRGAGACTGFFARRQRSPAVMFGLKYRVNGKQRWAVIGQWGSPWTPAEARDEAKKLLGQIVDGADPSAVKQAQKGALTVAQVCDRYLAVATAGRVLVRGGQPKKARTIAEDRSRVAIHILPLLGDKRLVDLTRRDVERAMHDIAAGRTAREAAQTKPRGVSKPAGGKGVATRVVGMLQGILSWAVREGLIESNPAHNVQKFAENKRMRRLSAEEYARLGEALRTTSMWPAAAACIRFLAITGWRLSEATGLRWRDVDAVRRVAILPDTKTGTSERPLSKAALDVLKGLEVRGAADLVFPSSRSVADMTGLKRVIHTTMRQAGIMGASAHTLRHGFASVGTDQQFNANTIGLLIGHKQGGVTQRYSHVGDSVTLAAADSIANEIDRQMGFAATAAVVIELRRQA